MIRAAAKNFPFAGVVVKPESYDAILAELRDSDRRLSMPTREMLAAEAFAYTARYDTQIARWFASRQEGFPALFIRAYEKVLDLPYGENPHQRGAYYSQVGTRTHLLSAVEQLSGRRSPSTTCSTSTPLAGWSASSTIRSARSSSTTTPVAARSATVGLDAYQRALAATRSAPSAA